jgi:hypothetical protein
VTRADVLELGLHIAAGGDGVRAARRESTTRRDFPDALNAARQRGQRTKADIYARNAPDEPARVRMVRLTQYVEHGSALDDGPRVHHCYAVSDKGGHTEVVGNQEHGQPALVYFPAQELEDLRLDRDVESRGRLVGEQNVRIAGERNGYERALSHPSAQLVRVASQCAKRIWHAELAEESGSSRPCLTSADGEVHAHRFGDLEADGAHGVQRREWVLEDH